MEQGKVVRAERRVLKERLGILHQLEDWLEMPMVILGFVWLLLLVLEFATEWGTRLESISNTIWIIFIIDFVVKLSIAPRKLRYLRANWLTLIALAVPALRIFRIFRAIRALRAVRAVRSIRLLRVVTSVNRGMKARSRSRPAWIRLCRRAHAPGSSCGQRWYVCF